MYEDGKWKKRYCFLMILRYSRMRYIERESRLRCIRYHIRERRWLSIPNTRRLTLKQTIDTENVLLEQDKVIDFPLKLSDLSRYDEVLYDRIYRGQAEGKPGSPLDVCLPR